MYDLLPEEDESEELNTAPVQPKKTDEVTKEDDSLVKSSLKKKKKKKSSEKKKKKKKRHLSTSSSDVSLLNLCLISDNWIILNQYCMF